MDPNVMVEYKQFRNLSTSCPNISEQYLDHLWNSLYQSHQQNRSSEPMLWIGIYIALASLICTLAMTADLLHGLRNRKLWFPCKYFTLNAASLTVIAVAIKLPMDLTTLMPGYVDNIAKLGSLSFMCTMMANFLPSLATMDSKELVSNMIALGLLVITLVVNVCIQISTGVISYNVYLLDFQDFADTETFVLHKVVGRDGIVAISFVGVLLMFLIIYICSSLAILESKQILESKYQAAHQTVLKGQNLKQPGRITIDLLKQHVSNYWIMAGTGCPQFMTACSVTATASGVICFLSSSLHILQTIVDIQSVREYNSDYKWSTLVIFIIQVLGVVLGTVAPLFRCFAALSFKLSIEWIGTRIKVFKVESYWTQKLYDMKHSSVPFQSSSPKCKFVIQNLKILILSISIGFQKTIVVICKMIAVIPVIFVIFFLYCFHCWKRLKAIFSASGIMLQQKSREKLGKDKDLSPYVLQLHDDMEFAERTLKRISKSVNHLIKKAEKQQPNNLIKLLAMSRGFEGVEKFDSHHVPPLLSEESLSCWSLTSITLTSIALSIPKVQKNKVDCLLSGVSEGLVYVTLVEESLNGTDEHLSIQKAAKTLWLEVELYHKWLGNKLPKLAPQGNTAGEILQWLRDKSKYMVMEVESADIGVPDDNSKCKSICANSMYRITETILLSYKANIDQVSQEELFKQLSLMIADILSACLTNLPQVIAKKCHTSAIEKREASVYAAAQLLGETMQIINTLKEREIPNLNLDELAYIEKWHKYLKDPFP